MLQLRCSRSWGFKCQTNHCGLKLFVVTLFSSAIHLQRSSSSSLEDVKPISSTLLNDCCFFGPESSQILVGFSPCNVAEEGPVLGYQKCANSDMKRKWGEHQLWRRGGKGKGRLSLWSAAVSHMKGDRAFQAEGKSGTAWAEIQRLEAVGRFRELLAQYCWV